MSEDKKPGNPMDNPVGWIFRASFMLLAAVIALDTAVSFLRPIMPWIIGGAVLAALAWMAIAIVRWRRSRW